MNRRYAILIGCAFALLVVNAVVLLSPRIPLGWPGEWVWNRTRQLPSGIGCFLAIAGSLAYAAYLWFGRHAASQQPAWLEAILVATLVPAGLLVQYVLLDLPTVGMERWPLSLAHPASSGYLLQATRIGHSVDWPSSEAYWRTYAQWVEQADNFHLGTHPPGLIWANHVLLRTFEQRPDWAERCLRLAPSRFRLGLLATRMPSVPASHLGRKPNLAEQATLWATAGLTWLLATATALPLYCMVRQLSNAEAAWLAAGAWPLVPGPLVFLPVADAGFPAWAVVIVTLGVVAVTMRGPLAWLAALLAGVCLFIGMLFTLAFLVVAFLAGLAGIFLAPRATPDSSKRPFPFQSPLLGFAGFLIGCGLVYTLTGLNLFSVWQINLAKHAGFYQQMPRSYWPWLFLNLFEFSVMMGPLLASATILGLGARFSPSNERNPSDFPPRAHGLVILVGVWLVTVFLLDVSGRNRSEAARLWLFLTPWGCCALALVVDRARLTFARFLALAAIQIAGALLVLACVEPLLPIPLPDEPRAALSSR